MLQLDSRRFSFIYLKGSFRGHLSSSPQRPQHSSTRRRGDVNPVVHFFRSFVSIHVRWHGFYKSHTSKSDIKSTTATLEKKSIRSRHENDIFTPPFVFIFSSQWYKEFVTALKAPSSGERLPHPMYQVKYIRRVDKLQYGNPKIRRAFVLDVPHCVWTLAV